MPRKSSKSLKQDALVQGKSDDSMDTAGDITFIQDLVDDPSPAAQLELLLSIKRDTASLVSAMGIRVDSLETRVTDLEAHKDDLCTASGDISQINTRLEDMSIRLQISETRLEVMSTKLQMSETRQKALEREVVQLKTYSMKSNIIFTIDVSSFEMAQEIKGEDCSSIIRQFLALKMGVTDVKKLFITGAHRIGFYKSGKSRPILAQFPIADERDTIMKHANRLRDTNHYISRQLPPELKERNQFAYPAYKDAKSDSNANARLVNGRLYMHGREQVQYSSPQLPVVPDPEPSTRSLVIGRSDEKQDEGSVFIGYASKISNIHDVSAVKQELIKTTPQIATANHLMMAFRYSDVNGKTCENFDSDGDFGVGLEMLKSMRKKNVINYVYFATRHCKPGYKHIGIRRFDHINTLCLQAQEHL